MSVSPYPAPGANANLDAPIPGFIPATGSGTPASIQGLTLVHFSAVAHSVG